jgi:hypothetical protein
VICRFPRLLALAPRAFRRAGCLFYALMLSPPSFIGGQPGDKDINGQIQPTRTAPFHPHTHLPPAQLVGVPTPGPGVASPLSARFGYASPNGQGRSLGRSTLEIETGSIDGGKSDVVTGEGKAAAQTLPGAAPASVHICVQSTAAATSRDSHESRQRGRKHVIVRNDANRCGPKETAIVGGEGLEPPTPSV